MNINQEGLKTLYEDGYRYIAADGKVRVYAFKEKPHKNETIADWVTDDWETEETKYLGRSVTICDRAVEYRDNEPIEIAKLIEINDSVINKVIELMLHNSFFYTIRTGDRLIAIRDKDQVIIRYCADENQLDISMFDCEFFMKHVLTDKAVWIGSLQEILIAEVVS